METLISQQRKELYTVQEILDLFGITRMTFDAWCSKGVFTKIKPGGKLVFIAGSEVEKLINQKTAA